MADEFRTAMASRSIRTIKAELEFLADTNNLTRAQLTSILSQLPSEASSTAKSHSTPAYEAPTQAINNLGLTSQNEKAPFNEKAVFNPPTAPPPAYAPAKALCNATALYQYAPQDEGDLAFELHDPISVTEYTNAEWWKGRNERTGAEGIFPRSYVRVEEKKGGMPMVPVPQQPMGYGNVPLEVSQSSQGQPNKHTDMGKNIGKKFGNAAVFGAGATMGSKVINSIF
ncbi:SH3-domain-containing protein [Patellaria atrata CBS 101060]|uniref:SH3-domain-containing protein n=1 Tax=Patellaria atrata CBS 101060 TaxID=1346257 RepID=A0A9P4SCH2_9PEZI|nr:SH3-domain-containing protein [Patellaria atrata CBS 101060]